MPKLQKKQHIVDKVLSSAVLNDSLFMIFLLLLKELAEDKSNLLIQLEEKEKDAAGREQTVLNNVSICFAIAV